MNSNKTVLTTGEVARICSVAPRTVSKWFDSGQLRGYRIPGSKDRRIPIDHLVRFMRAHGIPLNGLDRGSASLVVLDSDIAFWNTAREAIERECDYDIWITTAAFEAGAIVKETKPQVLIVDVSLPDVVPRSLALGMHAIPDLQDTRLLATAHNLSEAQGQALLQDGFDRFISKPFPVRDLIDAIESLIHAYSHAGPPTRRSTPFTADDI